VTLFGEAESYRRYSEDLRVEKDGRDGTSLPAEETLRVIFYQVFIPFLVAGFDNVGAGMILDHVQHWHVFKTIPELFILVASFLGLKGNLEMTLAARLATMANMGQLDKRENRWSIFIGNLTLVQGQAIIVAFLAALIAIFVNYFKEPNFEIDDCILLLMTGLTTASITGFAMASLMVCATILARKIGINPDNVSALIASIMGDISAIGLLAISANFFYEGKELLIYVGPIIITFYLILLPITLGYARTNSYTRDVVGTGWFPIITAMMISSVAGFVFDIAVGFFDTIAVVQPIVNGVGGNLIAVQASRISTYFHLRCPLGELPKEDIKRGTKSNIEPDELEDQKENEVEKSYRKTCPNPLVAFVGNRTYLFHDLITLCLFLRPRLYDKMYTSLMTCFPCFGICCLVLQQTPT
jgi:solute carrier family 41